MIIRPNTNTVQFKKSYQTVEKCLQSIQYLGKNDNKSLFIAFMGRFKDKAPTNKMMIALKNFLEDSVVLGKLHENYTISTNKRPDHKLYDAVRAFADRRFQEYNDSIT